MLLVDPAAENRHQQRAVFAEDLTATQNAARCRVPLPHSPARRPAARRAPARSARRRRSPAPLPTDPASAVGWISAAHPPPRLTPDVAEVIAGLLEQLLLDGCPIGERASECRQSQQRKVRQRLVRCETQIRSPPVAARHRRDVAARGAADRCRRPRRESAPLRKSRTAKHCHDCTRQPASLQRQRRYEIAVVGEARQLARLLLGE